MFIQQMVVNLKGGEANIAIISGMRTGARKPFKKRINRDGNPDPLHETMPTLESSELTDASLAQSMKPISNRSWVWVLQETQVAVTRKWLEQYYVGVCWLVASMS